MLGFETEVSTELESTKDTDRNGDFIVGMKKVVAIVRLMLYIKRRLLSQQTSAIDNE